MGLESHPQVEGRVFLWQRSLGMPCLCSRRKCHVGVAVIPITMQDGCGLGAEEGRGRLKRPSAASQAAQSPTIHHSVSHSLECYRGEGVAPRPACWGTKPPLSLHILAVWPGRVINFIMSRFPNLQNGGKNRTLPLMSYSED